MSLPSVVRRSVAGLVWFALVASPALMAQEGSSAPLLGGAEPSAAAVAEMQAQARVTLARAQILERARAYAEHRWTASADNVLHGVDARGVQVDTPDVSARPDGWHADGRENVGVPYKWGGFSSLDEFDAGVASGAPAGELTDGVDLDASDFAVGVDCSGFVARCWDLPLKQSTRSLGRLCFELDSFGELQPGDLINKFDAHAMVFVGFVDDARAQVRVIEATLPRVLENEYPVERLRELGFAPYRYKPLDPRWVDVAPAPEDVAARDGVAFRPDPAVPAVVGEEGDLTALQEALAALPDRLPASRPGDWVRYAVDDGRGGADVTKTRRAVRSDAGGVLLQSTLTAGGRDLHTQDVQPASASVVRRLMGWQDSGQAPEDLELVGGRLRAGEVRVGALSLPATEVELSFRGALTMRSRRYLLDMTLTAVLSGDVPLEGLVSLERSVRYHLDGSTPVGWSRFELRAAGRQPAG